MNTKILLLDCEAIFGGKQPSIYSNNYILFLLFFISAGFIHNSDSNIDDNGVLEMTLFNSITDAFNIKVKKRKNLLK